MQNGTSNGFLARVERIGNRLPDPATLFLLGTLFVMVLSQLAVSLDWSVTRELPVQTAGGDIEWQVQYELVESESTSPAGVVEAEVSRQPVVERPKSLLSSAGLYWLISHLIANFIEFPPLGIVLVGMLGIGVAEKVGLVSVMLRLFMSLVPSRLLTPAMVFIGIMSSMTTDAGYIVLPPLAALLYKAAGRSPLAGIAATIAGVGAGFNANLFITGLDPMLASFTQKGASTIDPSYEVAATCNWWFAIASTFVITFAGWLTTSFFVERRLASVAPEDGGPDPAGATETVESVTSDESSALRWAAGTLVALLAIIVAAVAIEGAPLHGTVDPTNPNSFQRWIKHVVPLLFFCFTLPALAFGIRAKTVRSDKDAAKMMIESIASMAPIIVLAFFAGQFIECFKYSGLDKMAALAGGQALGKAELSREVLIVAFIVVTIGFNLFVGSMSAKYAMFAPIFVPMFMLVGISPELTQAAYRIGDSVSNIITPLNAYLVIVLVFMKQVAPRAGMGTLIATMLPYTIVFTIAWSVLLIVWMSLGVDLGPGGPLTFDPTR